MTYRVVQTIQSINPFSDPTEVVFYTGESHAQALAALMTAATHENSDWYTVLSARIDIHTEA